MSLLKNLRSFHPFDRVGRYTVALDHVGGRHLKSDGAGGNFSLHPAGGMAFDGNTVDGTPTDVLTDSPLDFAALGSNWAICFDLWHDGDPGTILAKENPLASPNVQRSFRLLATGTELECLLTASNSASASAKLDYQQDQWQRIVLSKNGSGLTMRIEGVETFVAFAADVRSLPDVPLWFGRFEQATTATFKTAGGIKNLMIWDRDLTAAERQRLTDEKYTPPKRWHEGDVFKLTAIGGQSLVTGQSAGTPQGTEVYERSTVAIASTLFNNSTLQRFHYAGRDVIGIGPEMGMIAATDSDALVVHGLSGSNLHTDWAPTAGPEYVKFEAIVQKVKSDLILLGLAPVFEYFLWLQGTGDATTTNAPSYASRCEALFVAVRNLVGNDNLIIGLSHDWNDQRAIDIYGESVTTIRNQKTQVAAADPLVTLVDQTGFTRVDHVHPDWSAITLYGEHAAKEMAKVKTPSVGQVADLIDAVNAVAGVVDSAISQPQILDPGALPPTLRLINNDRYNGTKQPKLTWPTATTYSNEAATLIVFKGHVDNVLASGSGTADGNTVTIDDFEASFGDELFRGNPPTAELGFAVVIHDGSSNRGTTRLGKCLVAYRPALP